MGQYHVTTFIDNSIGYYDTAYSLRQPLLFLRIENFDFDTHIGIRQI